MTLVGQVAARVLLAPILMLAAATLVKGYTDVGDGFSAGVIAATGFALQFIAFGHREAERILPVRLAYPLALFGLGLALGTAAVPMLEGEPLLSHSPPPGGKVTKLGTLELITPVVFDLGICLLVLGTVVTILGLFWRSAAEER